MKAKEKEEKRGDKLLEPMKIMQRHGLERKRTNQKEKSAVESKANRAGNKSQKEKENSQVNLGEKEKQRAKGWTANIWQSKKFKATQ